jgi:hypothetical protein
MFIRRYCYAIIFSAVALFATMVDATHIHTDSVFHPDCIVCLQDTNQHSADTTNAVHLLVFNSLPVSLKTTSFIAKRCNKAINPRAPPVIS